MRMMFDFTAEGVIIYICCHHRHQNMIFLHYKMTQMKAFHGPDVKILEHILYCGVLVGIFGLQITIWNV